VELKPMSYRSKKILRNALPEATLLDSSQLMRFVRMVKTQEEIQLLKHSAQISEKAIIKSLLSCEGQQMGEFKNSYTSEVAKQGAVSDHFIYTWRGLGPVA
jgi:Xaa-Pro aminopeptidase